MVWNLLEPDCFLNGTSLQETPATILFGENAHEVETACVRRALLNRAPDNLVDEHTSPSQAALAVSYRLLCRTPRKKLTARLPRPEAALTTQTAFLTDPALPTSTPEYWKITVFPPRLQQRATSLPELLNTATVATMLSEGMKLHDVDGVSEVPALKANKDTSLYDGFLWMAKVLPLYQTRADWDAEPKTYAQCIFRELMREPWWKLGEHTIHRKRDAIQRLFNYPVQLGSVRLLWDALTSELPSTTSRTAYKPTCFHRDCAIDHPHEESPQKLTSHSLSSAPGDWENKWNSGKLSPLLEERFERYDSGGDVTVCPTCNEATLHHFHTFTHLAPFMAVCPIGWPAISISSVQFSHYSSSEPTDPSTYRSPTEYRLRGCILLTEDHFEAFTIFYDNTRTQEVKDVLWHDSSVERRFPEKLTVQEWKQKTKAIKSDGGQPAMIILERVR